MKLSRVTEGELEAVLLELGLREAVRRPGEYRAFAHKPTDTLVVLGWREPDDLLPEAVVVGTRYLLDAKGVIDAEDFDERLRAAKTVLAKAR